MSKKYKLLKDVVIKKGTILDTAPKQRGGRYSVEAIVAMGKDSTAYFNMSLLAIEDMPVTLIREVLPRKKKKKQYH